MSSSGGAWIGGKAALQRGDDLARVVDRQRRLGDVGERRVGGKLERFDLADRADQRRRAGGQLAHRADHFRVAGMADQQHVTAALVMDLRLAMDLGHQRAGRVDGEQVARLRLLRHRLGDAVGGEDHRPVAGRRFGEVLDEDDALGLERVDDMFVVDDLVPHIDRRAVDLERLLDHVDRAHDAGAEAARGAKNDAERRFRGHRVRQPCRGAPVSWKAAPAKSSWRAQRAERIRSRGSPSPP